MIKLNQVIRGDCVKVLSKLDEPVADLIFADPPFNIGYKYDVYEDRKAYKEYRDWTEAWMRACVEKALKPTGSFWVAIGDEYAAEVRIIGRELGLHLRNWVIWHYTFGQNMKRKFGLSHTHLFYFVANQNEFTFEAKAVRTFSDRQRVYNDRRADKGGRIPGDVWSEFPRVCGTFEQREGWHPCQMPESILTRIMMVSSRQGDSVLDPFAGSGTTLVVAKKLSRKFYGIELSEEYVARIRERLRRASPLAQDSDAGRVGWTAAHDELLRSVYLEAKVPTDTLRNTPHLFYGFVQQFNWRLESIGVIEACEAADVWIRLERLRKAGKLGKIRTHVDEPRHHEDEQDSGIRPLLFEGEAV